MKLLKFSVILTILFSASFGESHAQNRKAVGAAEVSGTFRSYFSGKYKDNYNEIKILALGGGKLRVALQLVYTHINGTGALSANTGEADGTATVEGDTAIFSPDENQQCRITIKFVKRGIIEVAQEGIGDCGFGHNVSAGGTYKKSSGAKPQFDTNQN